MLVFVKFQEICVSLTLNALLSSGYYIDIYDPKSS